MKIFIIFSVTFACGVFGNVICQSSPYEAIFNFGDSISDTGNAAAYHHVPKDGKSPYGSTYFKHPSGRLSNGRLIIDFISKCRYFLVNLMKFLWKE